MLFTIYTNDLTNYLEITELSVFADTTTRTATGESSSENGMKIGDENPKCIDLARRKKNKFEWKKDQVDDNRLKKTLKTDTN